MVKIPILPYLCPPTGHIVANNWMQIKGETEQALPARLEHWDPATPIEVSVKVDMDIEKIWQSCKLAEDDQLRLVLLWNSPGTNLRGRGGFVAIRRNGMPSPFPLAVRVNGAELAQEVRFELQLILTRTGNSPSKLAPHRPGSVLWSEVKTVMIGGEGTRFPVEAINFASQFQPLPEQAAWFLDWNPTALDEPFLRNVRLFLNTAHQAISKAIHGHTREDKLILTMIHFDVCKAMITTALRSEEFVQNHQSYKPGMVGAAIHNMIRTFFPRETIDGLAGRYGTSPARVECELQASFKLFEEV